MVDRSRYESNGHSPSADDYRRYLERRADAGNWFPFFRDYLLIMPLDAAVVVQSILNLGKAKSKDGWILCTVEYLYQSTRLDRNAQVRVLNVLKNLGFIEWEKRGIPAKRYIRVDILKLDREAENAANNQSTGNPVNKTTANPVDSVNWIYSQQDNSKSSQLIEKEKEDKEKERGMLPHPDPSAKSAKHSKPEIPAFCTELAKLLRAILRSKKNRINVGMGAISKWAEEFRLVWKGIGGDREAEIALRRFLKDYARYIDRIDRPIIRDAGQFREHFNWLKVEIDKLKRDRGEDYEETVHEVNGEKITTIKF
jgi:hypothetical protein